MPLWIDQEIFNYRIQMMANSMLKKECWSGLIGFERQSFQQELEFRRLRWLKYLLLMTIDRLTPRQAAPKRWARSSVREPVKRYENHNQETISSKSSWIAILVSTGIPIRLTGAASDVLLSEMFLLIHSYSDSLPYNFYIPIIRYWEAPTKSKAYLCKFKDC